MFVLGAANQKLWTALCNLIDRPDLFADPRFGDNKERLQNRASLVDALNEVFAGDTVENWVERLLQAGIPAGPINDFSQALASEHVIERQMVQEVPHPVEGHIKSLGFPVKLSKTPQAIRHHPPLLGEHTRQIVKELGLENKFDDLRTSGAFG